VIGVFPIVGLQAIQSLIAKLFNWPVPSLKKDYPLSDLDGLNVWYESRLLPDRRYVRSNACSIVNIAAPARVETPIFG
jgi:hypothetical protein